MIVDIAVPYRVFQSFHYWADDSLEASLKCGSVVQVPLKERMTHGFVIGFPKTSPVGRDKMKPIESVLSDEPLVDAPLLEFLRWVSDYYCSSYGEVLSAAIPRSYWEKKKRKKKADDLTACMGELSIRPKLTSEQQEALEKITQSSKPILLHGVTGSGKTEVYMAVLEKELEQEKSAIILVPEIALTPQLVGRFANRFPGLIAVLHSDLTPNEKADQYERIQSGKAKIVIGARSAVFAPIKNLGLIVIDEEQESSFKQEDSLRYHARDVAIMRAQFSKARVILGSATPSLESYSNAKNGKYLYVTLKNRVLSRPMPQTHFVDLRDRNLWYSQDVPWLSRPLISRIDQTLSKGNQVLLYLNRLGFAHFLFCDDCGHSWRCYNCDVSLTYYKAPPTLKCHYCGLIKTPPSQCEKCKGTSLRAMGVGTEQAEILLKNIFPNARIGRMDRGVIKNRKDLESVIKSISSKSIDMIIGTQMLAKGHDFPGIALVGVLLADASLNMPDFRANERTFQVITQVSGRSGRADIPGEVIIQTLNPHHPVLLAAAENRSDDFYRSELYSRSQFGFPPYSRLAMIRFQHQHSQRVSQYSNEIASVILKNAELKPLCTVLGPAESPLSRLKNYYRWQIMLKSKSVRDLKHVLGRVIEYSNKKKSPVQMSIDVDPLSAV